MTTETKHTPGPWEAMQNVGLCDAWVRGPSDSEGRRDICHLSEWQTEARQIANARLISAAPDMLNAMKEASRFMSSGSTPYNLLWDAIAKAEG